MNSKSGYKKSKDPVNAEVLFFLSIGQFCLLCAGACQLKSLRMYSF